MNYQSSSSCSRNVPCSLIYTVPPLMCCLRVIGFLSTPSPSSDIAFLFFVIVYLFTCLPFLPYLLSAYWCGDLPCLLREGLSVVVLGTQALQVGKIVLREGSKY